MDSAADEAGADEWESQPLPEYRATCLWDWAAENPDDLPLVAGEVVVLQNWDGPEWWYGSANGRTGWFPATYVEFIDESNGSVAGEQQSSAWEPRKLTQAEVLERVKQEIVATEKDYLKSLHVVIEGYKRKMELLDIPKEKIYELFGNIEDIHKFHIGFCQKLEKSLLDNTLPQLFFQEKDNFKLYSEYCTNHPKSSVLLDEYCKMANMKAFFAGCRLLIEQDIPLEGFLLTPIQRICKYPLLFKEMLKHTPEDTPEYASVQKAMEAAKQAASYVNDIQRAKENKKLINDLQSRIEGWEGSDITETNSELLLEAMMNKISNGKAQDRQFFLFDKLLVYCKESPLKKKHYQFKGRIALDKLIIKDLPDNPAKHITHAIELNRHDLATVKTYIACCANADEKKRWMQAIQSAQDKLDFKPESLLNSGAQGKALKPPPPPVGQAKRVSGNGSLPPPPPPKHLAGMPTIPPPKPPTQKNPAPPPNEPPPPIPALGEIAKGKGASRSALTVSTAHSLNDSPSQPSPSPSSSGAPSKPLPPPKPALIRTESLPVNMPKPVFLPKPVTSPSSQKTMAESPQSARTTSPPSSTTESEPKSTGPRIKFGAGSARKPVFSAFVPEPKKETSKTTDDLEEEAKKAASDTKRTWGFGSRRKLSNPGPMPVAAGNTSPTPEVPLKPSNFDSILKEMQAKREQN